MKKINKRQWIFTGLSILIVALLVFLIRMNVAEQKNNDSTEKNLRSELQGVSEYLTELDGNVLENQNKVKEIISTNSTEFLIMQEQLSSLQETLVKSNQELSSYIKEYKNNNSEITTDIQAIQKQLNISHKKIEDLQFYLTDILENMYEDIEYRLSEIDGSIQSMKESLEITKTTILKVLNELKNSNDFNYEILKKILNNIHQDISIQMEIDLKKIGKMFDVLTQEINNKLKKVRSQIQQTQVDISNILNVITENSEKYQSEILVQFENVTTSINEINADLMSVYDDIRNLIQHLEEQGNENYANTIAVLADMEVSIQNDLKDKLIQINQSFQSLNSDINLQFTSLLVGMDQNFISTNRNIQDSLSSIKDSILESEENLTMFFEAKNNEVSQKLDLLFQYVSNGKSDLASALLTKGISVNQDASFEEFKQGILNIKQQILVGIEKLPGEISYDYHYHYDANGNQPHTDTLLTVGGCYTVPVNHIHISSCYSTRACGGEAEKRTYMVQGCNCGPQLGGGTRCGNHGCSFDPPSPQRPSGSARCNCPKATEWFCKVCGAKTGGSVCNSPKTVLVCPKNGSTVDKYRVGCKLNDGQIIAAHIVYTSTTKTLNKEYLIEPNYEYIPPVVEDEVYIFVDENNPTDTSDNTSSEPELNEIDSDSSTEIEPSEEIPSDSIEEIIKNPTGQDETSSSSSDCGWEDFLQTKEKENITENQTT